MRKSVKKLIAAAMAVSMLFTSGMPGMCGTVYTFADNADITTYATNETVSVGAFIDGSSTYAIDPSLIGSTVNVDFDLINDPGINNATFFVRYDPQVLRAKSGCTPASGKLQSGGYIYYTVYNEDLDMDVNYPLIKNSLVNSQIAYVPSAGNSDYADVNADGIKTAAELGKVKLAALAPNSIVLTGTGHLFSMTFDIIGEGNADIYIEGSFGGTGGASYTAARYSGRITVGSTPDNVSTVFGNMPTGTVANNTSLGNDMSVAKYSPTSASIKNYGQTEITPVYNGVPGEAKTFSGYALAFSYINTSFPTSVAIGSELPESVDYMNGIKFKTKAAANIIVYAIADTNSANTYITDENYKVVDKGNITSSRGYRATVLNVPAAGTYYYCPSTSGSVYIFEIDIDYDMYQPDTTTTTTTTTTTRETTTETTTQSIVYIKDALKGENTVSGDGAALRNDIGLNTGGTMGSGTVTFNRGTESEQTFGGADANMLMLDTADGNFTAALAVKGNTVPRAARLENVLTLNAKYKGYAVVYAAADGHSIVLADENNNIVDVGAVTANNAKTEYTVPVLKIPDEGTYKVYITDRTEQIALYAVDLAHYRYKNDGNRNLLEGLTADFSPNKTVASNGDIVIKVANSQTDGFNRVEDDPAIDKFEGKSYPAHYQTGGTNTDKSFLDGDEASAGTFREALSIEAKADGTLTIDCRVNDKKTAAIVTGSPAYGYTSVNRETGTFANATGSDLYKTLTAELKKGDKVLFVGKGSNVPVYGVYFDVHDGVFGVDVDGDDRVTDDDAKLILKHMANISHLTNEQYSRADIDGNGSVDILDAIAIEKILG